MLRYVPFAIVFVFLFRGAMNFGQSYLTDYVGLRLINDVRNMLNRRLLYLSVGIFSPSSERRSDLPGRQ